MSQLSADPLRKAALNELLSVDAAALRAARRGEFHSELSRVQQQQREPPPSSQPPSTRGEPAEAAKDAGAGDSTYSSDSGDCHRTRSSGSESSSQTSADGAAQSSTTDSSTNDKDCRTEEDELKGSGQPEAVASGESCGPSAVCDDKPASGDAEEGNVVATDAPADAGPDAGVPSAAGEQAGAEHNALPDSGQNETSVPAAAADHSAAAEQQAQTTIEAKSQGPGPAVTASAALSRDHRDKAPTTEETAVSGESHREQNSDPESASTGSAATEIDIEALRLPAGGGLNRNRATQSAPGDSGPRRATPAADARAGSRRAKAADTPSAVNLPAAHVPTADSSPEATTTIAPAAAASQTITAATMTAAPSAPLPTSASPEAAPAVIGVRPTTATSVRNAATPADDGSPRDTSGGIDRARFVQRVAGAFRALNEHNHTLRLRLSPPELGSLRIEITVRNGQMSARLEAETAEAKNLLLDHLPALRERLAGQEIKIQQFQVEVADRQPGGGTFFAGQDESRRREARAAGTPGPARSKPAGPPVEAVRETRPAAGDGRLNVIV